MTRFQVSSIDRPKRLAKALRKALAAAGHDLALGAAQSAVADMLGYASWRELIASAGKLPPSLDDDHCDAATVDARRRRQTAALERLGVATSAATQILSALHPTNTIASGRLRWREESGGLVAADGGCAWWVGPADAELDDDTDLLFGSQGYPFVVRSGRTTEDRQFVADEFRLGRGTESLQAGCAEVEDEVRRNRAHKRELARLGRRKIDVGAGGSIDSPWGFAERATLLADGLVEVSCSRHGGVGVAAALVARMPEVLRSEVGEDGFAWYEEDCEAYLVVLGLPEFFTAVEYEDAKERVACEYPGIFDIVVAGAKAGPDEVKRARRGFREERWDWAVTHRERDDAGDLRVTAVPCGYWGPRELTEEDWSRTCTFLVPASEADTFDGMIDPDRHAVVEPAISVRRA